MYLLLFINRVQGQLTISVKWRKASPKTEENCDSGTFSIIGISRRSLQRIFVRHLHLYSCKVQLKPELYPTNYSQQNCRIYVFKTLKRFMKKEYIWKKLVWWGESIVSIIFENIVENRVTVNDDMEIWSLWTGFNKMVPNSIQQEKQWFRLQNDFFHPKIERPVLSIRNHATLYGSILNRKSMPTSQFQLLN